MAKKTLFVGGKHIIKTLVSGRPESIVNLWVLKDSQQTELITLIMSLGLKIQFCQRATLDKRLEDVNHQGFVAEIIPQPEQNEQQLKKALSDNSDPRAIYLILDQIQDPRNLGALLRTAECCQVQGIILTNNHSVALSAVARKSASGASELVNIYRVNALSRTIKLMKESSIWVYGLAGEASDNLYQTDFTKGKLALIIGSEGQGLRLQNRQLCDNLVHIPMWGNISSLNASVAGALALYEMRRQQAL